MRVKEDNNENDEDYEEPYTDKYVKIPGKEGKFRETGTIHDKYS